MLNTPGSEKVMTYRQAAELPRPIVLVNGTFDLLHPSHVKRLAAAAGYAGKQGEHSLRTWAGSVVVSLDTDRRVARLKGRPPVLSLVDRTAIIAPYPFVDAVVWHSDDLPLNIVIAYLCPDIWIAREGAQENELETAAHFNVEVVVLPRQGPHSSTLLQDRLLTR